MTAERVARIEQLLRDALAADEVLVEDDSAAHAGHAGAASGAGHFNVLVISSAFAGKKAIARHRMVYQAVDEMMPEDIHALSIRAYTPDEF